MSELTNDELKLEIAKAKGWRCIRFVSTNKNPPVRTITSLIPPGETAIGEGSEYWVTENSDEWNEKGYLLDMYWPTDIAAAWELADEAGFVVGPQWSGGLDSHRIGWCVYSDWVSVSNDIWSFDSDRYSLAIADTAPRAICLAWLKWKESIR
jgi:hypothetical protein